MRLPLILLAVVSACEVPSYLTMNGKTMGTYYEIQYKSGKSHSVEIDSLFDNFIASASTYDATSEISRFNVTGSLTFESPHLPAMLELAKGFHSETNGMFEPTLMPLIKAYGFSNAKRKALGRIEVDSLLSYVSLNYISYDDLHMKTSKPGVQLDLGALGEGYAIDMISDFLESEGVTDYKVEIGGEMKCRGWNENGERWLIGIEKPSTSSERNVFTTIRLHDEAISTSGTSRKFTLDKNGIKRSHIIDPRTGYSIQNNLLSVTIRDKRAVRADALATSLMVMGLDSAKVFAERRQIEAFIFFEEKGKVLSWHSPNFFGEPKTMTSSMR
jgi:FAD:protein FMN transferase